jgi:hypothetical protein
MEQRGSRNCSLENVILIQFRLWVSAITPVCIIRAMNYNP